MSTNMVRSHLIWLLLALIIIALSGCGGGGVKPPEPRPAAAQDFTFAVIGDPHVGTRDDFAEFCMARSIAEPLLQATVEQINARNVDFTIVMGDISNNGKRGQFLRAKEILSGLKAPYFPIPGNHDNHMSDDFRAYREVFGQERVEYSWLWKGFRFVTWHCISQPYQEPYATWHQKKISEIRQDLQANANLPTFFISHHQLYSYEPRGQTGEPWVHAAPAGSGELREVLIDSGNVIMAISGHTHRPRAEAAKKLTAVTVGTAVVYPAQIMLYHVSAGETRSEPMLIEDPNLLAYVWQLAPPQLRDSIIGRREDSEYTVIHRMRPGAPAMPATADTSAQ